MLLLLLLMMLMLLRLMPVFPVFPADPLGRLQGVSGNFFLSVHNPTVVPRRASRWRRIWSRRVASAHSRNARRRMDTLGVEPVVKFVDWLEALEARGRPPCRRTVVHGDELMLLMQ